MGDKFVWLGSQTLENSLSCREFSIYLDSFLTLPLINLLLDLSPEERAVLEHPNVDVEEFEQSWNFGVKNIKRFFAHLGSVTPTSLKLIVLSTKGNL